MKLDDNKLSELYDIAQKEAIETLKKYLLYIFKNRGNKFDVVLNCMGSVAFYKGNHVLWEHETENIKGIKELSDFLTKWNDIFKLTGYPVRIDKNGLKENNEF